MRIIADFHIHSKYSRAVSPDMVFENLDAWAKKKGLNVLGTGDFTHPQWSKDIKEKLEQRELGLFALKTNKKDDAARFMLTVEISSIYKKGGKARRVHNLIFAPSVAAMEKINAKLGWLGNLKSDGRPILGLDSKELLKIALGIDPRCFFVPAHIWTPWFSIFGSMSGFDSIEECFDEMSPHIFAIETGLSSDPAMNWRLSKLDNISIISNSDSHSLQRIAREANVFNCELSYDGIISAIKSRDPGKFLFTIEFFPEEGRYHYDGHRLCDVSLAPAQTKKLSGICPVCKKPLTIGVLSRVEKLADRMPLEIPENKIPFKSSVPLDEIIGAALSVGPKSKAVDKEYQKLAGAFGNEINILLDVPIADIAGVSGERIAEGVRRVRMKEIELKPGFDGEYGKIILFKQGEKIAEPQEKLF